MKRLLLILISLIAVPAYAQHAVSMKWDASSGAASYNVYRGTVSAGPYTKIASAASPSMNDATVAGGATYFYKVSAINSLGESGFSNIVTAVVPNTTPPPAPLYMLFFTWGSSAAGTFTWKTGTSAPASQSVSVADNSQNCEPITISTSAVWLAATSASTCTTPAVVKVAIVPAGLAVGTYTGNVVITGATEINSPFNIPVTLKVTAGTTANPTVSCVAGNPPKCTINGTTSGQSGTVTITPGNATATWSRP